MANVATLNRTLFLRATFPSSRGLDSESADLIATDPPFNKGGSAFEGTTSISRMYGIEGDVQEELVKEIEEGVSAALQCDLVGEFAGDGCMDPERWRGQAIWK